MTRPSLDSVSADYLHRHLRFGWITLLFFLSLGIVLEGMHGLKVGWYLDISNSTRRLMWTLAHAHGTLLALLQIAFATTIHLLGGTTRWQRRASPLLLGAGIVLPAGFFLGGMFIYSGDPGFGIVLVPIGAALLFAGVFLAVPWSAKDRSQAVASPSGGVETRAAVEHAAEGKSRKGKKRRR